MFLPDEIWRLATLKESRSLWRLMSWADRFIKRGKEYFIAVSVGKLVHRSASDWCSYLQNDVLEKHQVIQVGYIRG